MGFLNNLYEKKKGKLAAQASEQLEPGESVQRLLLARLTEKSTARQVVAFATEKNVYVADVGASSFAKLTRADVRFPIADGRATFDGRRMVLTDFTKIVRAAEDPADVLYDAWVLYPEKAEKTADRDLDDFAAYVNERSARPEARTSS